VFENRFPSMSPHAPDPIGIDADPELVRSSHGRCLVVVYTADHVENLADLSLQQFADVVAVWRERTTALWAEGHDYVMAFENHGSDVGATLPHLHGQLYAYGHLPPVIATKLGAHERHRRSHGDCLGCRLIAEDLGSERVIHANEHFVAAVPFASRWPLEVHVRSRQHGVGRLGDLDDDAALDLVRALSDVVRRYDHLWGFPMPYMMCVQEAPPPRCGAGSDDWHVHVELLPPHRNRHRLKVRASIETALGSFINDTLPERVAAELRAVQVSDLDWTGVTVAAVDEIATRA
jgi:UDPglucose--hexose-1-phosphate uridylyltransferase